MTQQQIIEGNKLIALFLNSKQHLNAMKFHKSYNWVMLLVDKIERGYDALFELRKLPGPTKTYYCQFHYLVKDGHLEISGKYYHPLPSVEHELKKAAIFICCVQYIQWYNKTKLPN